MALPSPIPDPVVELIAERFRLLSEPMRVRALDQLRGAGEASVGELAERLGTSQQNVSKHLGILHGAGIVAAPRTEPRHATRSPTRACSSSASTSAAGSPAATRRPRHGRWRMSRAAMSADDRLGPIGRLGRFMAQHFALVAIAWVVVAVGLGVFAPKVEHALSGAGWEATGSESVKARELIDRNFDGLGSYGLMVVVHSQDATVGDPQFASSLHEVEATLRSSDAVTTVVPPRAGTTISKDGRTAVVQAGAAKNANDMVRAADDLKHELAAVSGDGVEVSLTGAPGMWSDFNEANKTAMMKSELISWPVTLGILVLAFGSLVAAGLPLMLTIIGLVAAAGSLYLGTQVMDISIWAMNFALMFALALGIDYALFIVYRFRGAFFGSELSAEEATAVTMDTAGKAVLFSGLTVLISLSAVMLVPSPAFRSMSLGIMLSVIFILLATLTLLPAVLAKLGPRVDKLALKWVHSGEHRSRTVRRLGRAAVAPPAALRDRRGRRARSRSPCRCSASTPACRRSRSCPSTTPRASATRRSSRRSAPAPPARCRSSRRRPTRRRSPNGPAPTPASRPSCRPRTAPATWR